MRLVLSAILMLAAGACTTEFEADPAEIPDPPEPGKPGPGGAAGGEDNTYDHPGTDVDVWAIIEQLQAEGPLKYTSRVHGCAKMRYQTFAAVLTSRGVDLASEVADSAGSMYRASAQALGFANFGARAREAGVHTSASSQRMFDIFAQAAPEIITAMPTLEACIVDDTPTEMFDVDGNCTANGVACLIGVMPTAAHLEICNQTIAQASDPTKGRAIAVAALLSAAHTCE